MGQPLSVFFSAQRSEDYDEGGEAYLTFNGKFNFLIFFFLIHITTPHFSKRDRVPRVRKIIRIPF